MIHDMLPIRIFFYSVYWFCYQFLTNGLSFLFFVFANVKFWSCHLLHGTNKGWIISSYPYITIIEKRGKNVRDVIYDMLLIRNIYYAVNWFCYQSPTNDVFFFFFPAECEILVMSSTTWHQRRVDNILLTID